MEFQILHNLCDHIGLRYKEANFLLCQLSAFTYSVFFRTYLGCQRTSTRTRHIVQAVAGICLCIQAIGWESLYFAVDVSLCYILMKLVHPKVMQRYVSVFSITFLSGVHIYLMAIGKGVNNFDCVGPLMVVTEKVGCLAWSLHDGLTRDDSQLNNLQRRMAVRKIPSLLEYLSFIFYPQSLLIGPITYYGDYVKVIDGSKFLVKEKTSTGEEVLVYKEPSNKVALAGKLSFSVFCAVILLTLVPKYPIMRNVDDHHMETTTFWQKMIFVIVSVEVAKSKYFFGWVLADAMNNAGGLGFNGYDEDGKPKWDGVSNVIIWNFQFPTNLKMLIDSWNISALTWLRHTCYDRVPTQKALLTFLLSSMWHGFFPGFFVTFLSGHLMLVAAKKVRANIRPFFQSSAQSRMVYDVLTWATTYVTLAYIITPFTYLTFELSLKFFNSIYWWLHIVAVIVILVLPARKKVQQKPNTDVDVRPQTFNGHTVENWSSQTDGGQGEESKDESKKDL
ncbi:lysophospholipid acyltransferase 2-like [Diadema setosum]|uniref:lysophospholipid acyltransferase 2-like n=1 Tax=Diadema setosum TaxID=31175 RepID=UPI003B3BBCCF